jgi:hypothetical protein
VSDPVFPSFDEWLDRSGLPSSFVAWLGQTKKAWSHRGWRGEFEDRGGRVVEVIHAPPPSVTWTLGAVARSAPGIEEQPAIGHGFRAWVAEIRAKLESTPSGRPAPIDPRAARDQAWAEAALRSAAWRAACALGAQRGWPEFADFWARWSYSPTAAFWRGLPQWLNEHADPWGALIGVSIGSWSGALRAGSGALDEERRLLEAIVGSRDDSPAFDSLASPFSEREDSIWFHGFDAFDESGSRRLMGRLPGIALDVMFLARDTTTAFSRAGHAASRHV